MTDFSIIAVFFAGLLGGVHCFGMCGSIVGILSLLNYRKTVHAGHFTLLMRMYRQLYPGRLTGRRYRTGWLVIARCGAGTAFAVCSIQFDAGRARVVPRRNLEHGAAHRAGRQCVVATHSTADALADSHYVPSANLVARHVMELVAVRAGIQRAGHGTGQRSGAAR